MANNRLYVRCKVCKGKMLWLGKHYEDGWYIPRELDEKWADIVNDFHNAHYECFHKMHDNPYEILTEYDMTVEEDDESNISN